jgi:hypothetical protein
MLLHQDSHGGGTLLAAHVTDFASTQKAWRWRRSARRRLPVAPGLVFAKAMPFIGSGASAGFGGGVPALGRQVLLTAWRRKAESEQHMLRFAYGDVEGHGDTVRRDPPILAEQLNARLRVRRLDGSWGRGTMHRERLARLAAALP